MGSRLEVLASSRFIVGVVLLALGFGVGWVVHESIHRNDAQDTLCHHMTLIKEAADPIHNGNEPYGGNPFLAGYIDGEMRDACGPTSPSN